AAGRQRRPPPRRRRAARSGRTGGARLARSCPAARSADDLNMAPPTDLATMLPPLVEPVWAKWLVVAASYLITLIFASDIVLTVQRRLHTGVELALKSDDDDAPRADGQHAGVPPPAAITPQTLDTGWVIGRCEN